MRILETVMYSVVDLGCLSWILIFTHPGSRIQKQPQKRGVKKNYNLFRIPESKKAPDARVKKAPDPGSGSATLAMSHKYKFYVIAPLNVRKR